MEDKIDINVGQHALSLLAHFDALRNEEIGCDFKIKVGELEMQVHKDVLMAASDYFKAMFSHDTLENQTGILDMKDVDTNSVQKCIDFIYTGKASVSETKRSDLMSVAHMLQLHELCDGLAKFLELSLTTKSFFQSLTLANSYNCHRLYDSCTRFAIDHFRKVAVMDEFCLLTEDYVNLLLTSQENSISESLKVKALITWSKSDLDARKEFFYSMIGQLDFSLVSLQYLRYISEREPLIYESLDLMNKITALLFSQMNLEPRDIEFDIKNVIAVFDKTSKSTLMFNPDVIHGKCWNPMQAMHPDMIDQHFAAVELNGYIYVLLYNKKVYRLDYQNESSTSRNWVRVEDRNSSGRLMATVLDGSIYITDDRGVNKSFEKYDQSTKKWTSLPDKKIACAGAPIIAAKGFLFCIGGQLGSCGQPHAGVEKFDLETSTWTCVKPMNTPRCAFPAVEMNGRIYVFGGLRMNGITDTEFYDVDCNLWTLFTHMNVPRYFGSAVVLGNRIYVIGGDRDQPKTIEVYDVINQTWELFETMDGKDIEDEASVTLML